VRIREATIEDSAGIARVQVDSYRTAYAGIFSHVYLEQFSCEEQEQDWRDWIRSRPDDLLYVAELGTGEIVGYTLARPGSSRVPPYDSELVALHVRGAHQRQGLGRGLVAAIAQRLAQQGSWSMMLWVLEANQARGFDERLGGQLLDEMQISGGQPEVAYGWLAIEDLARAERGAGHHGQG